ncbi:multidrug ABC transporter permease [Alkalihalobacillus alcalophilus ATCC 27647 = CGMCC 1.3604]|uniref:Multidrug ABC transporter permease n=1 Tax=Alkalihalobacillus alcalophilus ATCC 27647 = CGMCC 1.3604 TaxID=1218173 RepID=J8TGD6_ALKAL|nr:ABC transporter ATP-binding protein [Alkalihalobacillus alcalophilus]AFV25609.1 multidrug transporter [Alkalihalobacillus alcalophilus ATCC 27647 = CGMCC 1.3604]KGA97641.1 multidrug ABC transporter permease [Alkalihalobacillus alcalophilus ATCC 27647 = CGMCC 1.3604]MED1561325.1 ABC transporter ATP-binding protein [Alkalihalobacillus alcalophilus]THG91488.1 multidrug ABC transporter permease [Alkalihalobacillus alcalophilus ATCC 27647 = CGMCC 1.3604]
MEEKETVPPSIKPKEFWVLLKKYRPALWVILLALLFGLGETAMALLVPLLTMNLVDVLAEASFSWQSISTLVIVFILQAIMSGFSIYLMYYVGQKMVAGLRNDLWNHILQLKIPFFDKNTSGETMSRMTNDTNIIKDFITMQVIPFISGIASIIGAMILLFIIDWKMTLLMLISVPLAYLIIMPLGSKMLKISRALQNETAGFQGDLGRVLSDIRLVKASNSEIMEEDMGKNRISHLYRYGMREAKIQAFVSPAMMSVMMLVLVLVIGYGGVRVASGSLTSGELVAIILYLFQVVIPFTTLAVFFTQYQKALGATERIQEIFHEHKEPYTQKETNQKNVFKKADEVMSLSTNGASLHFQQVHFSYQKDKPILQNLSFIAEAGKITAFVGPSGTGKTTIFSLIERFYEPNSGHIVYGKDEIKELDLQAWRQKIAYVSQESPMMNGTIYDNLKYGLSEASDEAIATAIEQANLTSFIDSLPQGLQTHVGERGVKLSGGQKQRLAIARAILRDPEILLLDEATAHLDSASEKLVQDALNELMQGRTTLVIAHRLSTVRHADQIIVIEKGSASGNGSHNELMESHDFYQQLVQQQLN